MTHKQLSLSRIVDLVRTNPRLVIILADLGISPRYLEWTLESAANDLGINLDRAVARIQPAVIAIP